MITKLTVRYLYPMAILGDDMQNMHSVIFLNESGEYKLVQENLCSE